MPVQPPNAVIADPVERPILFNQEMVKAVMSGLKTQTRRIIKPQPDTEPGAADVTCPYGKVGDRLWVRETWSPYQRSSVRASIAEATYAVFPDGGQKYKDGSYQEPLDSYAPGAFDAMKYKPSIHMPRWACRTVLEITGVRVGRVQETNLGDIVAEMGKRSIYDFVPVQAGLDAWMNLWVAVNGQASWDRNDWVWAIDFKILKGVR